MDVRGAVGVSPNFSGNPRSLQTGVNYNEVKNTKQPGDAKTERENTQERLATYQHWTGVPSPTQLAVAGFTFTGENDRVVCTFCGLKLYNWTRKEKPLEVHKKYSPDCTFLNKWFPLAGEASRGSSPPTGGRSGYDATIAKHKEYISIAQRVSSFVGWPLKGEVHSAQNMSMAGFFYIGSADRVRCFYCSLSLRDWDKDDDPFSAHKQWSPRCDYINLIASNAVNTRLRSLRTSESSVQASPNIVPAASAGDPGKMDSVEPSLSRGGRGRWEHSPSVQALLDFGYTIDVVQKAMTRHKEKHGYDFKTSTDLFRLIEEMDD
ncbi:baculoviral IAP repeat-containing protein 7-A-like [Haliotis cracherodii]|uniref:baculoviral IAP repeat-containing protein 7-A-like n=1 Tax=Haliotis cracherodii TaxID=6455 RepID=UPI0039E96237